MKSNWHIKGVRCYILMFTVPKYLSTVALERMGERWVNIGERFKKQCSPFKALPTVALEKR